MNEPIWLDERVIRQIHGVLAREHGSPTGLRDEGLLAAALARPRQHLAYGGATPDLHELAALYAEGIVRNHPFVDGNKRAGFMAAYIFLASNGLELDADEAEATHMVVLLAAGAIGSPEFATWLRINSRSL